VGDFAERSARATLLLPGMDLARIKPLVDLSDSRATVGPPQCVRAMYEYRGGRFDSAVHLFEDARRFYGQGSQQWKLACLTQSLYWLAMTHHRLGNGDAATKAYQSAENRFRQSTLPTEPTIEAGGSWHDWLQAAVTRREAQAVLAVGSDRGGRELRPPHASSQLRGED
jgi:hypothetical protein